MRVAVDGRSLRTAAPARGVSVYLDCLLAELRRSFPEDHLEPVVDGRLSRAAAAAVGRPRLDRLAGGCDVVWAPAPAPLAVSRGVPLVLTVHDRSWEQRHGDHTRRIQSPGDDHVAAAVVRRRQHAAGAPGERARAGESVPRPLVWREVARPLLP